MNPQPETGQMDGGLGLILKGDGRGEFEPLMPGDSGIVVPGQGMALTVTDMNQDGAPDLMMSVNDRDSRQWLNQTEATTHGGSRFTVELSAGPGNPTGVGALVLTRTVSGMVQADKVTAGAGYLSQSAPVLFLTSHASDLIEEITIRWPDGSEQKVPVDAEPTNLKIQKQ